MRLHRHVLDDAVIVVNSTTVTTTVVGQRLRLWLRLLGLAMLLPVLLSACARGHAQAAIARIDWQTSPLDLNLRGMIGSSYLFRCLPGKPTPALVTGSGVYTDASSICAAAVHAGAIQSRIGGVVKIQILPGQNVYQGSTQNFLSSQGFAHPWTGSFAVLPNTQVETGSDRSIQ